MHPLFDQLKYRNKTLPLRRCSWRWSMAELRSKSADLHSWPRSSTWPRCCRWRSRHKPAGRKLILEQLHVACILVDSWRTLVEWPFTQALLLTFKNYFRNTYLGIPLNPLPLIHLYIAGSSADRDLILNGNNWSSILVKYTRSGDSYGSDVC
jgi:hypothetical protein